MAKRAAGAMLEIELDFASGRPLHRQLYEKIKASILQGRLRPGARLASTRTLAADLGLSRTTVLNAFQQLIAEGYLKGRIGAGTAVAEGVPLDLSAKAQQHFLASRRQPRIARRVRAQASECIPSGSPARPLRPGVPETALFPLELWSRLASRHWRRVSRNPHYADSRGYRPLREAICGYVARLRGVRCEPDQILIVGGAQQALYLCAHALLDPGETVWMEDPGYPRARAAFAAAGVKIVPVPVDNDGLVVSIGLKKEPAPRLIYLTPSFQCPLGVTLSLSRRFELLRLAAKRKAWIIEDDYFSEYRYGRRPVPSLQSLDRDANVIYVGNFSKSLVPSLRIGYLVLPPALMDVFVRVRTAISRQPPGVDQAVLADFIHEGHLDRYLRTVLRTYRERQQALVSAIEEHAGDLLEPSVHGTGMYLVAWLKRGLDDRKAAMIAADSGVDVVPLSEFAMLPMERGGLVLGFSSYHPSRIRVAVRELAGALKQTGTVTVSSR